MMRFQTGFGFDVHALEESARSLMICGIEVPSSLALVGHSDADVGLHALTDALLGAMALGDIGEHFPPSDARWQGADSAQFLQHALALVNEAGGSAIHADITIIGEQPKIAPHRLAMRERVAALMGLPLSRISVKATTTERLGFTGRGEGLAAQAVVTVEVAT